MKKTINLKNNIKKDFFYFIYNLYTSFSIYNFFK